MSRGVASRGCVVWASAVGVAPCGPSLVGVVWARPVLYCIVLGGPGTRGLARGAARALLSGVNNVMLCYVIVKRLSDPRPIRNSDPIIRL